MRGSFVFSAIAEMYIYLLFVLMNIEEKNVDENEINKKRIACKHAHRERDQTCNYLDRIVVALDHRSSRNHGKSRQKKLMLETKELRRLKWRKVVDREATVARSMHPLVWRLPIG